MSERLLRGTATLRITSCEAERAPDSCLNPCRFGAETGLNEREAGFNPLAEAAVTWGIPKIALPTKTRTRKIERLVDLIAEFFMRVRSG